jgi:hypothetical protein
MQLHRPKVTMSPHHNEQADRRPAVSLKAGQQFGAGLCAPASLSAAAAGLGHWRPMIMLTRVWVYVLTVVLCGCGYPTDTRITLRLSPAAVEQIPRSLSPVQSQELNALLELTDATLPRHGMTCIFKEAQDSPAIWKRDSVLLREYKSPGKIGNVRIVVRVSFPKEEAMIGFCEIDGWVDKKCKAAYLDLRTNVVAKFGVGRVRFQSPRPGRVM